MTDNELLLAISDMLDQKLDAKIKPLENDIKNIRENDIRNIRLDTENIIKQNNRLILPALSD